ncbi:hypothetical protein ACGFNU_21110 [Spirillospora sp. NPDC048911]|uniref:hypothetical protein n=1 Tax=Spirillospora sp. NPDC048911 TaxID=3364527 RepID=UPI00371CB4DB
MRLLAALDRMHTALTLADAPTRQLRGVWDWRVEVAACVEAASVFTGAPGLVIDDTPRLTTRGWRRPLPVRFLFGERTHAAWLSLCSAISRRLWTQRDTAEQIYDKAVKRMKIAWRAGDARAFKKARRLRELADRWFAAANRAIRVGDLLVATEDAVMRPVGKAIRKVGIADVAKDKRYHDRSL